MISDILQTTFLVGLLISMIRISTPILLAALGELVTEHAGILNLGVEGNMLMGALVGFITALNTDSLWLGVGAAILAGGAMGLIMAFAAATLKVSQTLTGLALNLFASGITFYWYRVSFPTLDAIPTLRVFPPVEIPLLSKIPFLGEIVFKQYMLSFIALLMVPAVWFFLYRTKLGLQLRCLGENPRAVDTKGVNINRLQYGAVIFGGMMAGIGGAYLTLAYSGLFVADVTAGRGWMALVAVIAGNWKPGRIMIATSIFGLLEGLQLQLQGVGVDLPYQIFLALPYVVAIVFLVGGRIRARAPLSLGVPYSRD